MMVVTACSVGDSDEPGDDAGSGASTTIAAADNEVTAVPFEGDSPTVSEPIPTTPPLSTARSYEGDGYPAELTGLVTGAVDDLAAHLGVDSAEITVGVVEEVVWPNGGLGCPRPGMAYTQVPTDGLRIVLTYDGEDYVFHSGGSVDPFLCLPWPHEGPTGAGGDLRAPIGEYDDPTDGTIVTEKTVPPSDSVPTDQVGGPSGEPDE